MTLGVLGKATSWQFLGKDPLLWFAKDGAHVCGSDALKPVILEDNDEALVSLCVQGS